MRHLSSHAHPGIRSSSKSKKPIESRSIGKSSLLPENDTIEQQEFDQDLLKSVNSLNWEPPNMDINCEQDGQFESGSSLEAGSATIDRNDCQSLGNVRTLHEFDSIPFSMNEVQCGGSNDVKQFDASTESFALPKDLFDTTIDVNARKWLKNFCNDV